MNKFTQKAGGAISSALTLAQDLGHSYIGTEHLLLGLILQKDSIASRILILRGANESKIKQSIINYLGVGSKSDICSDDMTPRLRTVIENAAEEGEFRELLIFRNFNEFFRESDDVGRTVANGGGTGQVLESGIQRGAFGSAGGQAVFNDHNANVFRGQHGAKTVAVVDFHTDDIDEESVFDARQAFFQFFGNNIFNKLAHSIGIR